MPAAFYDGSVRRIQFREIFDTGVPGFGGTYNNRNPYGQFYRWATRMYGE